MEKRVYLLLLLATGFFTSFSVYAVNYREAKIFVPPIFGTGRPGDNSYFYRQLTHEVILHFQALIRSPRGADYILKAEIEPFTGISRIMEDGSIWEPAREPARQFRGRHEFFSMEWGDNVFFGEDGERHSVPARIIIEHDPFEEEGVFPEYLFFLQLLDAKTLRPIAQQEIVYQTIDSSMDMLLSIVVYNMLSGLPDIIRDPDWRNKWLFAGLSAFWSPRVYTNDNGQSVNAGNVGLGAALNFQFLPSWALEAGLEILNDTIIVYNDNNSREKVSDVLLEIPVAVKFVFKPMDFYIVEPYFGIKYNLSVLDRTDPFLLSWIGGVQLGIRTGGGFITIDSRFASDMDESGFPGSSDRYKRAGVNIGIGYKIGLFAK